MFSRGIKSFVSKRSLIPERSDKPKTEEFPVTSSEGKETGGTGARTLGAPNDGLGSSSRFEVSNPLGVLVRTYNKGS